MPFSTVGHSLRLMSRSQRAYFFFLVLCRAFSQAIDLVALVLVAALASMLAPGSGNSGGTRSGPFELEVPAVIDIPHALLLVGLLFVAKSLIGGWLLKLTTRFLAEVETAATTALVRHMLGGGTARLKRFSAGEQLWLAGPASQVAFSGILFAASAIISESSLFVLILGAFLLIDWSTALVVGLYFGLIFVVFQKVISVRLSDIGQSLADQAVGINEVIGDSISTFREAASSGKLEYLVSRFSEARRSFSHSQGRQRFYMGVPRYFVEIALVVGVGAVGAVQWLFYGPDETLVSISVMIAGGFRLIASLLPLQNAVAELRTLAPQARQAQEVLKEATQAASTEEPKSLVSRGASILPDNQEQALMTLDEVTVAYSKDTVGLAEVAITFPHSGLVAVAGASGSGKSTLADLMAGLIEPDLGGVMVLGHSVSGKQIRSSGLVAYVPQFPGLFGGSVAENVLFGDTTTSESLDSVRVCLAAVGLEDWVASLPSGLHTRFDNLRGGLSGGQKQRLALARALLQQPEILIVDEGTSALDSTSERTILQLLADYAEEHLVVAVAHRPAVIDFADRLVLLQGGTVVFDGDTLAARSHRLFGAVFNEQ